MTLDTILIGLLIIVGILLCVFAVIGALYWGLVLPFAVLLFMGGVALIVLTAIAYYIIL